MSKVKMQMHRKVPNLRRTGCVLNLALNDIDKLSYFL